MKKISSNLISPVSRLLILACLIIAAGSPTFSQTLDDAKYYYDRATGGNPKVDQFMYYRSVYMANMEEARIIGSDLTNLSQLKSSAKTPDELISAYRQKTEEINNYIQQKQDQLNREIASEAIDVLGDMIFDGSTDPASIVTNGLSILQRKGQVSAEKEKALAELTKQMHSQMDQLKEEIITSTWKDIEEYLKSAAFSFTDTDEKFYLDFADYLYCYIQSMKKNYNYENTVWLKNNCEAPLKPFNIPNKIQTEWEQLYLTAVRKIDLYNSYERDVFLDAARKYTEAAVVKNEKYFDAYYLKSQIVDNSAERYASLLIASNLKPNDLKVKQEKDEAFAEFKTDFFNAITENDVPYLQKSIKYKLYKGIKNSNNEDPIVYSIIVDNPDALQLFLNEEAEQTQAFMKRMENLLFLSAIKNADGCCNRLIKLGVDHNTEDRRGYTPLLIALKYDASAAAELLLSYQTNYDSIIQTAREKSLMETLAPIIMKIAIEEDNLSLAEKVYKTYSGVAIQSYADGGFIVVHAVKKSPDISKLLISPEHVFQKYDDGNALFHYAVDNSNRTAIDALLSMNANVNIQNDAGETPVHRALTGRKIDELEILVNAKPDLSIKDNQGKYPIHLAAAIPFDRWKSINHLFINKEIINKKDNKENTPLHYAAINNNEKAVEFLLKNGAEKYAENKSGVIPYELLPSYADAKLKQRLRKLKYAEGFTQEISTALGLAGGICYEAKYGFNYSFKPTPVGSFSLGTGLGFSGGQYQYYEQSGFNLAFNLSARYSFRIIERYFFLRYDRSISLFGPWSTTYDNWYDYSATDELRRITKVAFGTYFFPKKSYIPTLSFGPFFSGTRTETSEGNIYNHSDLEGLILTLSFEF